MASAYELMLVLRGRNYLSNDLRRAGADLNRLRTMGQLQNARSQLSINAQRLASTRSMAQEEIRSIQRGTRRVALDKAIATQATVQQGIQNKIKAIEDARMATNTRLLRNAEEQARLSRVLRTGGALPRRTREETQMIQAAAQRTGEDLAAQQVRYARQLEVANAALANQTLAKQGLIERDAALAAREAQLTDVINTTSAAEQLNTQRLVENGIAMERLPLEKLAARARYVEHLGRAFQTLGLISTAALGYAAHSASQFNTQITLAATQSTTASNNSTKQVLRNSAVLQQAVQKLLSSGRTAARPAELTDSLYTIFSGLSLKGNQQQQLQQGLQILEQFNRVFTANYGQVEFNEVTKAGIALINNFGLSVKQLPGVLNRMQASVRFGAMNMTDFVSSLNQVVPAFRGAHYGFDQLAADVAFVSRLFPSLRVGTTGLARLTETFAKYHEEISKDIGTNIAPGGNLLTVNQIVSAIVKAHPLLAKGGVDLQNYFKTVTGATSTVQARRVFVGYATQLALYGRVAGDVLHDNNELSKSFTDMSQTPQVRWAEFTNQLRGLILEIGTRAIPVFQQLAGPIKAAVHWFDQLSPSTKKLVTEIAVFTSVGMLLGGTLLVVVGAAARLYATLKLLGIARSIKLAGGIEGLAASALGAKGALAGLGGEAGAITASAALGLGAVAAIPLLLQYHHEIGSIVQSLGGMKTVLHAVSLLASALLFRSTIASLRTLGVAIATDNAELVTMRALLGSLAAIGAIVITIIELRKIVKDYLPGLGGGVASPTKIGPQTLQGIINRDASTRQGVQKIREAAKQYTGQGADIFNAAENLFLKIHDPNKVFDILRKRYRTADSSFIAQIVADAGTLMKNAARNIAPSKLSTPSERTAITNQAKEVQVWINKVNEAHKVSLANPTSISAAKSYETVLAGLNKRFKDQPALLKAINDVLSNYTGNMKDAVTSTKSLEDIASNVMSMYDSLLQQNQSVFGQLFSGPYSQSPRVQNRVQYGGQLTAGDYLKDLKSQTAQFKTFYSQISKLQGRGAPQELIQQLIQAGPTALPAIKALAGMGRRQWQEYISTFNRGQELLHKQTVSQLKAQLTDYRKYGNNIALQIISGMRDKRLGLANEIKTLIHQMFGVNTPEVTKAHKTSIANVAKSVKQAQAQAIPHDAYSGGSRTTKPIPGTHSRTPSSVHNETHYHVVAPTSEHASVKTQLRHAEFARKTKYSKA